jgi:formamidopyrimidine-DNA glycosylase
MPELPEVETVVRGLRAPLLGRTIQQVWWGRESVIRALPPSDFAARIAGQRVHAIDRRAKYILIQLDHDVLVVHLKMTGRLYVVDDAVENEADRWVRWRAQLDNGKQLRFSDARRFGFVALAPSFESIAPRLGPEPLTDAFAPAVFAAGLARHHRAIKVQLMDQAFIAGIGNIYADESLHRAGIHPLRYSDTLTAAEASLLYDAIRTVLQEGIEREGASVNWYRKPDGTQGSAQTAFYVYDRTGAPCLRCGTPVEKIRVGGRGTHYCPACQPLQRPEAD